MKTNPITQTARELRDLIDQQHAVRMSEILGCSVTILRRVPVQRHGKFIGISEPVYGMPAEFIEQAQSLGMLAEAR